MIENHIYDNGSYFSCDDVTNKPHQAYFKDSKIQYALEDAKDEFIKVLK